jgi:hypothetical protein
MAEPSPDSVVVRTIGPLITTVTGAVIGWLPGGLTGAIGSPLTVLLAAVGDLQRSRCGCPCSISYRRANHFRPSVRASRNRPCFDLPGKAEPATKQGPHLGFRADAPRHTHGRRQRCGPSRLETYGPATGHSYEDRRNVHSPEVRSRNRSETA